MNLTLTEPQARARAEFAAFAARQIAPLADAIDRDERVPRSLVSQLARAGCLASGLPPEFGGGAGDPVIHGLMHEALGQASASVQGLVNVHHMAASSLARWGTREQKQRWLPRMASGELLAAFALTEPGAGSDGQVATCAVAAGDHYRLTGTKRWITGGALADVFVLFARGDDGPAAFVVPADTAGLTRTAIPGLLGCRGYMLATLALDDCRIPVADRIGAEGFGLSHVLATGLDHGRHNLAWSCVGQAQACLDASVRYAEQRTQFGAPIASFQLVQRMLTRMIAGVHGARLLCWRAAAARAARLPGALYETLIAKYQASTMLNEVADHALQIHGANGCGDEYPIQRYLRDARIMEIIEGSTQMLEILIARLGTAGGAASTTAASAMSSTASFTALSAVSSTAPHAESFTALSAASSTAPHAASFTALSAASSTPPPAAFTPPSASSAAASAASFTPPSASFTPPAASFTPPSAASSTAASSSSFTPPPAASFTAASDLGRQEPPR